MSRPIRARGTAAATLGAGLAVVAVLAHVSSPETRPTANTVEGRGATVAISGYVFDDANDNGAIDPGELGIPGIRVRDNGGDLSTLTGNNGWYSFPAAPSTGYLQVETGWFRSQCPTASAPDANSCPPGPGADNTFAVNNQLIQLPLKGRTSSSANVGLIPDWPGSSMVPASAEGEVLGNPVDIAARLSFSSGTCGGGRFAICGPGDTFTMIGQIFNQGTGNLTGVTARVYVPPGDCVTKAQLVEFTVPAGLGEMTTNPTAPTCDTRYLQLSFTGTFVPAGGVRVLIHGTTAAGPGTPGCDPAAIDKALCPREEPQGRGWLLGVSHIDQTGDPDSTFCAAGDMTSCPTGLHDKRRTPDELDPAGHNVAAALGGSSAYDLRAHVEMVTPTTIRAWASNDVSGADTNVSPEKTRFKVWLPQGATVVAVPTKHTLISCDNGTQRRSATVVTCVFGGPIAPTISSPAVDITLAAPPSRVVVCVTPPSSGTPAAGPPASGPPASARPTETVPAAATCSFTTNPDATPTDNDAITAPATPTLW